MIKATKWVNTWHEEMLIFTECADMQSGINGCILERQQPPNLEAHVGRVHGLYEFNNFLERV